jgi:hypothetical protein
MVYTHFLRDHAFAHVEALEEDSSGSQRQLWQFEQNAGLYDEVDALRPAAAFFLWRKTVHDRGRAEDFFFGKKPLT